MRPGAVTLVAIIFSALSSSAQSTAPQTPQAAPPTALTIPSGEKFILQLDTAIHTNSTRTGDRVEFRVAGDIFAENRVVIPTRSWVRATVTKAKRAGRLAGRAEVQVRLDEVRLADGTSFPLRATIVRVGVDPVGATKDGQPRLKGEAGTGGSIGAVASAGAQGALIGVLMGGARGAMYGGAAGAAISLAGMVFKRGPDLDLPRDTMFEARFDQPLTIPLEVVQRAEQRALSQPPEQRAEVFPTVERGSATRPALRRGRREEQAPVENPTNPPPDEPAAIPSPVEATPSVTPPAPPTASPGAADTPPSAPAAAPPPTPAREAPAPDPGGFKLSVSVKMVLVDAVVRDRAGRMIDSLAREDFRIYEDGTEQQIRSFSCDQLPLAVALVIDRSGSVAPYISELRRIANQALQQLKPGDKVALFSFAHDVERLEDLTTDRERIAEGISRIRAGGSTDIIDALFDAVTYLAKTAPDYRRAIILVSDNEPTVRPEASEGLTIRRAMETETVVYSLKTSGDQTPLGMRLPTLMMGMGSVQKVAHETGGEVIDVADVHMLDAALGSVISRLRLRYALGYYPSNQAQGGAFHAIEVRLVERLGKPGSDYFMHARRGYYSTGNQTASGNNP
jgi:VWFA-related protein